MRLLTVIAGVLVGAVLGLMLELAVSPAFQRTYCLPLLLMMVAGALLGALIGKIMDSRSKARQPSLEHLPAAIAEFVGLVVKKMRYRRKVRADVAAELAAHFDDALKDCKTDEERDRRARELIAEFGDVKLLGVLLRRAKKRCRPLWRTIAARTFQAMGLLIVLLIIYIIWFLTGKPRITVDYVAQLNRMVRPAADESLNAAPLYNRAAELYGKCSDDFLRFFAANHEQIRDQDFPRRQEMLAKRIDKLFSDEASADPNKEKQEIEAEVKTRLREVISKRHHHSTAGERKFVARWLEEKKQALDLVIAGTKKPYHCQRYDKAAGVTALMWGNIQMPHLSDFRYLAVALCYRASLRAESGLYQEAFADVKSCYRLGQQVKHRGTLIEQLVGIAVESLVARTLLDILAEYQIDSTILAALQHDLEKMMAEEDFAVSFETEKIFAYDAIQRLFTEDRLGQGHLSVDGLKMISSMAHRNALEYILEEGHWTAPLHILFTHPNKRQTREMVDRLYTLADEMSHMSPAELRVEKIDFQKELEKAANGNLLLEFAMPALARITEIAHYNRIHSQALIPIIALLRYNQDRGIYPTDLHELISAGYLTQLPMDPYSDKPLVYKRTADGFVLYSFGPDFDDDGGEVSRDATGRIEPWPADGDVVLWPVDK
ncbi:MAG TPA: hypothetical protein VMX13_07540 [Sedimentisphaerales bacterium]|nr:hypothetical protein [Sedimentisphaerales bacterium]